MKRGMGPEEVAEFIDVYLARKYGRLLDRFFAGTIVTVTGTGPFTCMVQRTGETQADGNTYMCMTPRYKPAVGDLVECMWRDNATGYVLWSLTNPPGLGTLGYAPITVDSAETSGATQLDITGLSSTITVGAGRRVRISAYGPALFGTTAGDLFFLSLYEGLTQLIGAAIPIQAGSWSPGSNVVFIATPTAGSHTYKVSLQRSAGTGTAHLVHPAYILVEDIT